jgi:predicted transposase YbfD/YdcC
MMGADSTDFMEERSMPASQLSQSPLRDCFQDFPDPRREHLRLHSLWDIVGLVLCAVICGCDNVVDIRNYGIKKREFLSTFLDFDNGIPSHDTIGRVLSRLDPEKFRDAFAEWTRLLAQEMAGKVIAIDGKTLRRSHEANEKPLHVVSAFAAENRLVLTQRAVAEKSNEITAIPQVLKLLDVKKAIVTIDAMGCQKAIAAQIVAQGGDYVLGLKDNQPTLHQEVRELFEKGLATDFAGMKHQEATTEEKGHGRKEKRVCTPVKLTKEFLSRHPEWSGLKTVGMICSERQIGDGEATGDVRFYISSLTLNALTFARAVRDHWGIENNLHWVLDVGFREDESRVRKDHAGENLAWVRRMAAGLLAKDGTKAGVASKRKMAGWDDECLLSIAGNALA